LKTKDGKPQFHFQNNSIVAGDGGLYFIIDGYNDETKKQALEEMRAAVEASPDHPAALFLLGRQLLRVGRIEEAARHLESCARLSPRTVSEVEPFLVLVDLLRSQRAERNLERPNQ